MVEGPDNFETEIRSLLRTEANERLAASQPAQQSWSSVRRSTVRRSRVIRSAVIVVFVAVATLGSVILATRGATPPAHGSATTSTDDTAPQCGDGSLRVSVVAAHWLPTSSFGAHKTVEGGSAADWSYTYAIKVAYALPQGSCSVRGWPLVTVAHPPGWSGFRLRINETRTGSPVTTLLSPGHAAVAHLELTISSRELGAGNLCTTWLPVDIGVPAVAKPFLIPILPAVHPLCGATGVAQAAVSPLSVSTEPPPSPHGVGIRVTIAGGCPRSVAGYSDVSNPAASKEMVPAAPKKGLICLYGSSFAGSKLIGDKSLNRAMAAELARVIDKIQPTPGSQGPSGAGCPADVGSAAILVFGYAGQPDQDLWYHDSGCESLDNHQLTVTETANPSFYNGFMPAFADLKIERFNA
jgi:hypothetical protein